MDQKPEPPVEVEERPPLFGWNGWYALVLGLLAFLILVFTLFTNAFS